MAKRIDAHHHLWRYTAAEYGWIDSAMTPLQRDYTPTDLLKAMESAGIDGAIAVQARQTLEETYELLSLAEAQPFMDAVVGWAPIASKDFPSCLEDLYAHPKL